MDDDLNLDYGSDNSVDEYDDKNDLSDDNSNQQPKDRLDEIIDRKEKIATERAFGISDTTSKHLFVSIAESSALRKELGATDQNSQLDAIYVHGVESMDEFEIQKMFADFQPERIWKKSNVAMVQFHYRQEAAAMMLNMSKMMRRVRGRKIANEEGEVMSDDDDVEEGQIMQEKDDDVELIEGLESNEKGIVVSEKKTDFITVDISAREVPNGKWRVLTKHVPANMFVLVRFATLDEFKEMVKSNRREVQKTGTKRGNSTFWTQETSTRGGLNVFDKEGKELEWDYEHDTRFYNEEEKEEKVEKVKLPQGVKVKGRGAVKCGFLFGEGSSSLASDDSSPMKKRKGDEKNYEKDDVVSRMGSTSQAVRPGRVERPMRERIRFPGRESPDDQ